MTAQPIDTSVAVYRALLHLYPADHRAEYGPHMTQVFRDCCRDAYRRGSAGLLELWLTTLLDLLKTAFEERARRGIRMNSKQFVQLAGIAGMLGGVAATTAILGTRFVVRDPYQDNIYFLFFLIGLLLIAFGVVGGAFAPEARQGRAASALSTVAAVLAALGALGILGGAIGANYYDPLWNFILYGYWSVLLSVGALALSLLQGRSAWRPYGLLLLTGAILASFFNTMDARVWLGLPFALSWSAFGLAMLLAGMRAMRQPAV